LSYDSRTGRLYISGTGPELPTTSPLQTPWAGSCGGLVPPRWQRRRLDSNQGCYPAFPIRRSSSCPHLWAGMGTVPVNECTHQFHRTPCKMKQKQRPNPKICSCTSHDLAGLPPAPNVSPLSVTPAMIRASPGQLRFTGSPWYRDAASVDVYCLWKDEPILTSSETYQY